MTEPEDVEEQQDPQVPEVPSNDPPEDLEAPEAAGDAVTGGRKAGGEPLEY